MNLTNILEARHQESDEDTKNIPLGLLLGRIPFCSLNLGIWKFIFFFIIVLLNGYIPSLLYAIIHEHNRKMKVLFHKWIIDDILLSNSKCWDVREVLHRAIDP